MSAKILDGRAVAKEIQAETEKEVKAFTEKHGTAPTLALVRAGDDPASVSYARMIKRTAEERGIAFQAHTRSASASEAEVVELVRELSADRQIVPYPLVGWVHSVIHKAQNSHSVPLSSCNSYH